MILGFGTLFAVRTIRTVFAFVYCHIRYISAFAFLLSDKNGTQHFSVMADICIVCFIVLHVFSFADHLIEQILAGICKDTGTETGNRAMVRCFLSCKQPHEIDISAAGSFDFSGRIDSLGIRIGQDLEYASFF